MYRAMILLDPKLVANCVNQHWPHSYVLKLKKQKETFHRCHHTYLAFPFSPSLIHTHNSPGTVDLIRPYGADGVLLSATDDSWTDQALSGAAGFISSLGPSKNLPLFFSVQKERVFSSTVKQMERDSTRVTCLPSKYTYPLTAPF